MAALSTRCRVFPTSWAIRLVLVGVAVWTGVSARAGYVIEDLGTLYNGTVSYGVGLASNGSLVGTADQAGGLWRAVYSPGGVGSAQNLGTLPGGKNSFGYGVNSSGQVVGSSEIEIEGRTYTHAFITDPAGKMLDLGTLSSGGMGTSKAFAISEGGYVTGYSTVDGPGGEQAFRIGTDGVMKALGTLPGGYSSVGYDINETGAVTGTARTDYGAHRAFLFTDDGGMISLGALPTGNATHGMGLNSRNEVVGYGDLGDGSQHAFFWSESRGLLDLGMPFDATGSLAHDINARSEIVGFHRTRTGETRATLWKLLDDEVIDLNSLLPTDSGWLLTEALGINDAGQIVGTGRYNGQTHGFRLSLGGPPPAAVPEPSGIVLFILGGSAALAFRRFRAGRTGCPERV